ncbi:MAG: ATP-dependent RNA helicase DbpA [Spongiibacteraceae bacterium]
MMTSNATPDSSQPFTALPLPAAMLDNLTSLGFTEMTPIQAQSLPWILQNRDLIGKAKTGSGKTAAFGIGLLCKLNVKEFRIQSLVLCPTRELANQVGKDIRQLARYQHNIKVLTLCGGVSIGRQIGSLEHGAHIIVGTPGRIQDHLRKGTLDLQHVHTLVLDEADRMLDMGFADAIKAIISVVPKQRQTLLFSATYPDEIKAMSASIQRDPAEISVAATHSESQIQQIFYEVDGKRSRALIALLEHHRPASAVIFCNTKVQCQEVADALQQRGFAALALHGDMEQKERDQVLVRFANKSVPILVATDVAARGLDIKDLAAVINYEVSRDPEVHIHRIGRTGRAGNEGLALSLFTREESGRVGAIETFQKRPVVLGQLDALRASDNVEIAAAMVTIQIDAGRKDKVRAGDILGALTGPCGIPGSAVGKIDISDFHAYVAIASDSANQALQCLANGKIKGRSFKVRKMR